MLSIETEARIAKLFLELAKGENTIESTRRIMTNNYDFDAYQVFNYLDMENKNRIDSLDIINYLNFKKFHITDIEAQLIILFYDQDFDGVLTYDEFKSLLLSEYALSSKSTANNFLGKVSGEIDECLFNILENEVRLVRNCLSILEELKTRKDFNVHKIYHTLRGANCINAESIKNFLMKKDVIFSDKDIISVCKRLDLNKDGKIDISELHAFFGYPYCSICCPSSPCPICKVKDCNICFKDCFCYFHNRIHDDFFSRYIPDDKKMFFTNNDNNNLPGLNINNKIENDNNPNLNTNNKIENDNINNYKVNDNNIEEGNSNSNINKNNKTSPEIKYNENYFFDYNNNNENISAPKYLTFNYNEKLSPSKKVSKNLLLRSSPKRKYNPNRFSSPSNLDEVDGVNKNNINPEIKNDNDVINEYLYEKRNNDEKQFLNYLKEAMITEKKIEDQKIKLSLNNDFNCEDAFRIFEENSKEIISKENLKYGLNLFTVYPSNLDLDLLMNKYSLKNAGILKYGDFFDIVVPYDKEYRNKVEERMPNSTHVYRSPNIFSYNTRNDIKDLFKLIIEEENILNNLRKEFSLNLKKTYLKEFFKEMDIMRNRYFNQQDLLIYIQKKEIFIDENACDLLFIRLDRNRNGIIEFEEIEKEINSIF